MLCEPNLRTYPPFWRRVVANLFLATCALGHTCGNEDEDKDKENQEKKAEVAGTPSRNPRLTFLAARGHLT